MDAVGADHLDRVAAAGQGQQGVDGYHQRVVDGGGGDRDVDRGLVPASGRGRVGRGHQTVMVGVLSALPAAGAVATVPTEEITPGVVWLSGRVMVTLSPTATSDCWAASRAMVTWRVVEVAVSTGCPGWAGAPSVAETAVTRAAVGRNTAWPRAERAVLCHPERGLELLDAVFGPPGELVGAGRDLGAGGVAERDQVGVQLGHVGAGHIRRQGSFGQAPVGGGGAVEQHHRVAVHPVENLPLGDHLAHRRQRGDGALGLVDHAVAAGVAQRGRHLGLRREVPADHRGQRGRIGVAGRARGGRQVGRERMYGPDNDRRREHHDNEDADGDPSATATWSRATGRSCRVNLCGRHRGGRSRHPPPPPWTGLVPSIDCPHVCWADGNAGVRPRPDGPAKVIWPFTTVGSGKSETPWARIHAV